MKIAIALGGVQLLYIETAPIIYFVEQHPTYISRIRLIMQQISGGVFRGTSSTLTLTEVLMQPIRQQRDDLITAYRNILSNSANFRLVGVSAIIAEQAAHLRANYNLKTPDALHIATALEVGADAFLTNDRGLLRVTDIKVIVLDDLEPS